MLPFGFEMVVCFFFAFIMFTPHILPAFLMHNFILFSKLQLFVYVNNKNVKINLLEAKHFVRMGWVNLFPDNEST